MAAETASQESVVARAASRMAVDAPVADFGRAYRTGVDAGSVCAYELVG